MNRNNVETIKARLPIEEVIGSYVKLDKAGKSFKARCPFHNEKSASFFISPDRGGYYCFGCGAKGDIFSFVEQFEGLDFKGALKVLADRAGIKLVYDTKADSERDQLLLVIEESTKYFEIQLEKSAEASKYVKGRGITDSTRKEFRIGFAPEGWRNLSVYLKGKGFAEVIMEKAGLVKKPEDSAEKQSSGQSSYYDRFRGRIMFPIFDSSGRVIAFSGRILKEDKDSAKYLNSPETPLYDKAMVLYGLDKAKSEIRRLGYSILVEGQMDLVMSHQAGIKNTVASSGTALSDAGLNLVRRLSPNIIVAFDSDDAGRKAAMRAAGIALSMNMDVKIADIVGGKDPADLVKEDIEKWKQTLRQAKQIIEFEIDNIVREFPDTKKEAKKLSKAIQDKVFPLLVRIESNTDRSRFVQMINDKAHLPMDAVWEDLKIVEKRIKPATGIIKKSEAKTSSEVSKRIDLVERRMFGLLELMDREKSDKVHGYREELKKITGHSYGERLERVKPLMSDLLFEAESFFGNDKGNWDRHARELMTNFEEDLINEEIVSTMQELKVAESLGNNKLVGELAQKCQILSMKKAEIGNRRKV